MHKRKYDKDKLNNRLQNELATDAKFMDNFNPDESSRTQKKLRDGYKNTSTSSSTVTDYTAFDDRGRYRSNGVDACDCLIQNCVGCHFPCPNCGNPKCGPNCRVNRKTAVSSIEVDGSNKCIYNTNMKNGR